MAGVTHSRSTKHRPMHSQPKAPLAVRVTGWLIASYALVRHGGEARTLRVGRS